MSSAVLFLLFITSDPAALCAQDPLPHEVDPAALEIAWLDEVINAHPRCMPAHYFRAMATLGNENRDVEAAIGHLERANELAPGNVRVLVLLGQLYLMRAQENTSLLDARKGKRLLEEAVESAPEDLDARSVLAGFHRHAPWIAGGDIDEAYAQANEIRRRDLKRGLLEQARTLAADGKEDKAIALARDTLQAFPEHAPLALDYALLMHRREQYREAHRVLATVADREDADLRVLYQLGRTAALSGEFLEDGAAALERYLARGDAGEILPIEPAEAWWRFGMIAEHAQRIADARIAYERALELNAEHQEAAEALRKLGE